MLIPDSSCLPVLHWPAPGLGPCSSLGALESSLFLRDRTGVKESHSQEELRGHPTAHLPCCNLNCNCRCLLLAPPLSPPQSEGLGFLSPSLHLLPSVAPSSFVASAMTCYLVTSETIGLEDASRRDSRFLSLSDFLPWLSVPDSTSR